MEDECVGPGLYGDHFSVYHSPLTDTEGKFIGQFFQGGSCPPIFFYASPSVMEQFKKLPEDCRIIMINTRKCVQAGIDRSKENMLVRVTLALERGGSWVEEISMEEFRKRNPYFEERSELPRIKFYESIRDLLNAFGEE